MSILTKQYWIDVLNPQQIVKTTIQTIIGTILIGSFFMVASDYIFPPPNIHGKWEFTTYPDTAKSKTHSIMELSYTVRIFQEGNKLKGVGEKIQAEIPKNNLGIQELKEQYNGKQRTRIELEGFIEKNYFLQNKIKFIYHEGGSNGKGPRKTVTIQSLTVKDSNTLIGNFDSTISDSMGKTTWKKIND